MAQTIVTQRPRSPWEIYLPQFLQQMMAQNFATKQAEVARGQEVSDMQTQAEMNYWNPSPTPQPGSIKIGNRYYTPPKHEVIQKDNLIITKRGPEIAGVQQKKESPNMIQQYNFAKRQYQAGEGPDPGPFTIWKEKQSQAGATRISIGEKLGYHKAKKEIDLKQSVRGADFRGKAIAAAKAQYDREWQSLTPYQKDTAIWTEMDSSIKAAYPDDKVIFGVYKGKTGWWLIEGKRKKLIQPFAGNIPGESPEELLKHKFRPLLPK